jgi:D-alanyl-D-alanine endopeptidase (penicillin-binding protein 7)
MSPRARRTGWLLLIASLMLPAPPAAHAATAPRPPSPTRATLQQASGKPAAAAPVRRKRRRRGRRAPPGGVYARNAIVVDPGTGAVLFEKNASVSVPIASLTKLMTDLVFLESKPDLDRTHAVARADLYGMGHTQLRPREVVSLSDLLHMSLMCSDNAATRILVQESGLEQEEFLARMNRKAVDLGMTGSRYVEFTGLDERNVSTAADCAVLLRHAASNPIARDIMTHRSYEFRTNRRSHLVPNTNRFLYGRYEVRAGKTGFIAEAGYCFATWINAQGRELIAVVLGAPTNSTRFADVSRLINLTLASATPPVAR